jgi:hypothetical protein
MEFQSRGILDKTVLRQLWDRTWEIAASFPEAARCRRTRRAAHLRPERAGARPLRRSLLPAGGRQAPGGTDPRALGGKDGRPAQVQFLLVQGESGKKLQEVSVWSDGRVDRALASGMTKVIERRGIERCRRTHPPRASGPPSARAPPGWPVPCGSVCPRTGRRPPSSKGHVHHHPGLLVRRRTFPPLPIPEAGPTWFPRTSASFCPGSIRPPRDSWKAPWAPASTAPTTKRLPRTSWRSWWRTSRATWRPSWNW